MKKKSCIEMWMVSVILCVLLHAILCEAQCNQLVRVTDCVCPGQNVIYRCSVMGGSFTVYSGTSFQCLRGDITLRNDQFESGNSIGVCNGEQFNITGRGLTEVSNCYTSQVNISLGEAVSQSTVSCAVEGLQLEVVDTAEITPSTVAFSPPSGVSLAAASPSCLTFAWNSVSHSCPSLIYSIMATNCGRCPDKTSRTSINCTDFSTSLAQSGRLTCMLSIQTVICDSTSTPIAGNITSKTYTLKVPSAPRVNITPYYDDDTKQLIGFEAAVALLDSNPIFAYDSVDGSARYFTVSLLGINCGSATTIPISPESCDTNGICTHYSETICLSRTTVAVYVTNVLGNGNRSTTTIDNRNDFVTVDFALEVNPKIAKCIFRSPGMLTCTIRIGNSQATSSGRKTSDNVVTIYLDSLIEGIDASSYFVTASNGTYQVVVDGTFSLPRPRNLQPLASGAIAGIVIPLLLVLVVCVHILIGFIVLGLYHLWHEPKTHLIKIDCESETNTSGQAMRMEAAGQTMFGNKYNHGLGVGYRVAEDNEVIKSPVNVIAKDDQDQQYYALGSHKIAVKFVKDDGRILPANERGLGYKGFTVLLQCRDHEAEIKPGGVLVLCENYPVTEDVISQTIVQPKVEVVSGSDVSEVDHWFVSIEVKENDESLKQICEDYEWNFEDSYKDENTEICCTNQGGVINLPFRKIMATHNENHRLYELKNSNLDNYKSAAWEIYYQMKNDCPLKAQTKVLLYNRTLKRVRTIFHTWLYEPDHEFEASVLSFVQEKVRNKQVELGEVYLQCELTQHLQNSELKFMAMDYKGNTYSGICRSGIKYARAKSYKWKWVCIEVTEDHSNDEIPRNAIVLYCASTSQ